MLSTLLLLLSTQSAAFTSLRQETDRELAAIRAQAAESRWRLIGFRGSLVDALAEAKRTGKPVYYFGADGRLDTGNC